MKRGVFVAFEGGDGAGKSVQIARLAQALRSAGLAGIDGAPALVTTREPGGSQLGAAIRGWLLDGGDVDPVAEALLYAADRAQHVADVIEPALAAGAVVLSDRFVDSSIAYQAQGRGLPEEAVRGINHFATGGLAPNLTVLLNIDPVVAAKRREAAGDQPDRLELAGLEFHARVNAAYRQFAAREPERYLVVDAALPVDQVAQLVWQGVERLFSKAEQ